MTRPAPAHETVTIHVPFRVAKRGGRKEIQLPPGAPARHRVDNTIVKALARAFRWKCMLEAGEFASISELAEKETIAFTYMARLLRMTLLAPDIVDVILSGDQPAGMTLTMLMEPFPLDWDEQHALWLDEHQSRRASRA
jgi:hypothetical protein